MDLNTLYIFVWILLFLALIPVCFTSSIFCGSSFVFSSAEGIFQGISDGISGQINYEFGQFFDDIEEGLGQVQETVQGWEELISGIVINAGENIDDWAEKIEDWGDNFEKWGDKLVDNLWPF